MQLEQRLAAAQVELRKLGSERHTLRARLRREAERARELESALRAEKELREQATEERQAVIAGLRARVAELELERAARAEELAAAARPVKAPQGLRRIRGIGPGYERLLEQCGVTRVQQIAAWSGEDVLRFAEKLRIKPERILKDDWVNQAKALTPDAEG